MIKRAAKKIPKCNYDVTNLQNHHTNVETPPNRRHRPKGKPVVESSHIPSGVQKHFDDLRPYFDENLPESTACELIGLDFKVWDNYCARYPALRIEAKRLQATRLREWKQAVEAGAQGWQAAAVLLERRDPGNWSRTSVGRPTNTPSPYGAAVKRKR